MRKPTPQQRPVKRVKSPIPLVNFTSEDIPPFAALEVVTFRGDKGQTSVRKPTEDGATRIVFNLGGTIRANGGTGSGAVNWPVRALYDDADGTPATSESWGTKAGSFKLAKGKFGLRAIAGTMDGPSVLFFPESTCRTTTSFLSYYETFDNPCCGGVLPKTLCANHIGSLGHDGGVTLDFWNALPADRPSYPQTGGSGLAADGIIPPPWIPDIRTESWASGVSGKIHDGFPFLWESIMNVGCDTSKISLDANSPGRKNWLPTWWSPLYHDFDCAYFETAEGIRSSNGVFSTVHKWAEESEYYSFYVYMNLDYPVKHISSGFSNYTSKRCALTLVQLKKTSMTYSTQDRVAGVPSGPWTVVHNTSWPNKDWAQVMIQQGYIETGDYPPTQQLCNNTLICDPFALQTFMKNLTPLNVMRPSGIGTFCDYALILTAMQAICPVFDMVANMFGFGFVTQLNGEYANEPGAECTEDQECHQEWQIVDYPIIGYVDDDPDQPIYDYDNPIYGYVTVCNGLGTYTATGPRVDTFVCNNGDPFPDPDEE